MRRVHSLFTLFAGSKQVSLGELKDSVESRLKGISHLREKYRSGDLLISFHVDPHSGRACMRATLATLEEVLPYLQHQWCLSAEGELMNGKEILHILSNHEVIPKVWPLRRADYDLSEFDPDSWGFSETDEVEEGVTV